MENELKSLKKAMDDSVFQAASFDASNIKAVRESIQAPHRRKFPVAAFVTVAALFIVILLSSNVWLQANQPASPLPIAEPHVLEGMIFQGQTNAGDALQFIEGDLTVFQDPTMSAIRPWVQPEDIPAGGPSEITYPKIDVKREDSLFSIHSEDEFLFTLTQTAPRMYEDSEGNVYSTQVYIEGEDDFTATVKDFEHGYQIDGGQIFGNNEVGITIYMNSLGTHGGTLSILDEYLLEKGYTATDSIYLEFPDAEILTDGSIYTIQLNEEETLTFEKIGKRIIKDEKGREYYSNYMPD